MVCPKIAMKNWSLSLEFTIKSSLIISYIGVVFSFMRSLSFLFLDDYEGDANISVRIKSGSTVFHLSEVSVICVWSSVTASRFSVSHQNYLWHHAQPSVDHLVSLSVIHGAVLSTYCRQCDSMAASSHLYHECTTPTSLQDLTRVSVLQSQHPGNRFTACWWKTAIITSVEQNLHTVLWLLL